ncbi:xylulokinase [Domibacillus enclensis]|uniref:Xylulokinase n=1 Tax=Domibacillus enclensis TaxID=1017273 RepID=A0A1N7C2B9_9BACI|nr:FGGY family carbohydrate kinase [Domibacillus enclensis]OXS74204.1 xylulose kinase [Domibacillus enclensis]SIR57603.1 xylulokinase [Domibacillus enclensis]
MSHVIGIDVGTSGIKVASMDRTGICVDREYKSYSLLFPKKGYVEIDPNHIWEIINSLLEIVWNKVSGKGEVDAVSLSCFCNSSIFMDEHGRALTNGIMYLDQRSKEEASSIKEKIGEEKIFHITGNRVEPGMHTVTTKLWTKKHHPQIYSSSYKWGSLSTFILHKLTGKFVMDWTHASFTGLFDIHSYQWSKRICDELELDEKKLPEIHDPKSIIGDLTLPNLFSAKHVPVIAGAADTACSAYSLGIEKNELFESIGTSNVLTVCTEDASLLDKRFLNRCHVERGQWLSHGAMSFPGAAIDWFYKNFLAGEGHDKSVLNTLAEESIPGSNGVFFLPYMHGERSPIWDTEARGSFVGMSLTTTKPDLYRAVLEGCSFGLKQIFEIINQQYNVNPSSIPSIGGGSKNKSWCSIKSTVFNKEFEIKSLSETAVLGACLLAGKAVGYFENFRVPSEVLDNQTIEKIFPNKEHLSVYEELYSIHSNLYPSLKDFFQQSARSNNLLEERVRC